MHEGAHVHDAVKGLRVVLLGLLDHERAGDRLQRLGRPRREPVDGRAVDEGRELADAVRVVVAERRHGEHDLEELLAHLDEHRAQVGLVRGDARLQAERRHLVEDRPHVGILKQVGHLARREDVVDVLEEDLVGDLRVDEEEDDGAELDARHAQHRLQVLAPLERAVVFRDLDLEALEVREVAREAREGLAARASHAEEQAVAARLAQHAADAAHVRDGVGEEHEVHRHVHLIVLAERLVHLLREPRQVGHLFIDGRIGALQEVAVEQLAVVHRDDGRVALLEGSLRLVLDLLEEPLAVFVVDQTVGEDARRLVHPDAHNVLHLGPFLLGALVGHKHALHYLGHVAKVEGVVWLGGRRAQVAEGCLVDRDRRLHHLASHADELVAKGELHEGGGDRREDQADLIRGEVGEGEHVHVADHAVRHDLPAAARRAHGADESTVDDLAHAEDLAVVPAALDELAHNLDRRLRAVRLALGHVEVVDEDGELLA